MCYLINIQTYAIFLKKRLRCYFFAFIEERLSQKYATTSLRVLRSSRSNPLKFSIQKPRRFEIGASGQQAEQLSKSRTQPVSCCVVDSIASHFVPPIACCVINPVSSDFVSPISRGVVNTVSSNLK